MRAIKSRDTKPEMIVRKFLHAQGLRYRLHVKDLPGKPDLVFPKYRTVVFVHGCFWHMHLCERFRWPKTRRLFWKAKLMNNGNVSIRVRRDLKTIGWRSLVVWECRISFPRLQLLESRIRGNH